MKIQNSIYHLDQNGESAFFKALDELLTTKQPVKTAYALVKISKELNEKFKSFMEVRMQLFKKYGEEKENGDVIVSAEKMPEFSKEYADLMAIEEEYTFEKVKVADCNISAYNVMTLESILDIE